VMDLVEVSIVFVVGFGVLGELAQEEQISRNALNGLDEERVDVLLAHPLSVGFSAFLQDKAVSARVCSKKTQRRVRTSRNIWNCGDVALACVSSLRMAS